MPMPQMTIQQALQLAVQHQRAGRLKEAEALYRQVLTREPRNAEALNTLGVLSAQTGRG